MDVIAVSGAKKVISILGCGWYGLALARALLSNGLCVKGSTTSPQKMEVLSQAGIQPYLVSFSAAGAVYDDDFFICDVLIVTIPAQARLGRGADFTSKIEQIIDCIKRHGVKNVVFISSTAVYADMNAEVDENTPPQPNTEAGRVLFAAENLFRTESLFKTTIIRFAGLIGPGRDPGRFFARKQQVPNGNAPVNLIHLDDCIGISKAIVDKNAFGYLFNGCLPHHPTRSAFYTNASLNAGLEPPQFIDELKEWKIVKSVNAEHILGYHFKVTRLA